MPDGLKEMVKIVDNSVPKKSPEEKEYLLCITVNDGRDSYWTILKGRTEAYEFIKNNIDTIDMDESFILVENCVLAKRKSIYAFMKHAQDYYPEDTFDIDAYCNDEEDNPDYWHPENEVNSIVDIPASERLTGADLMGGVVIE